MAPRRSTCSTSARRDVATYRDDVEGPCVPRSAANSLGDAGGDALDRMSAAIARGEFARTESVIVQRLGEAPYEFYAAGTHRGALRNTRSATKTVAGMLVGAAIDRGILPGVQARVLPYFEEGPRRAGGHPRKEEMTVEDLLTMSSCLECDDANPFSRGNEERMYLVEDWTQFTLELPVRATWPSEHPRREFSYCTAGVGLLGDLLTRATGRDLGAFAQEVLFGPLGIDDARWKRTPLGVAFTGGGLELTSVDLAKLGLLYLDEGRFGDAEVLTEGWVRSSLSAHVEVDEDTRYGYLWWLRTLRSQAGTTEVCLMQGNGGNKVCIVPDARAVVVITATNFGVEGMHELSDSLLVDFILPALGL